MSRVLVLCADLLFGSRIEGQLAAAGDAVELLADRERVGARLGEGAAPDVLIVDLMDETLADAALAGVAGRSVATLGFYSHVDRDARERGERSGLDLVVPRSRLAREAPALVASL